jgi:hypothetical protein
MRVLLFVLALLAMPLAAGVAQGQGNGNNKCMNAVQAARAASGQRVPPGQAKKDCPDPVPPPAPPPPPPPPAPEPGIHAAKGAVYEDIDGNGDRDVFASEMGLAGWTVQLFDANGQVIASASTDADGNFEFTALANGSYSVCVVAQSGYTQTQPVGGSGCGGAGYSFSFSSTFMTWWSENFGMMLQ